MVLILVYLRQSDKLFGEFMSIQYVRFRFLFDLSDFKTLHNDTDEIIVLWILSLDKISKSLIDKYASRKWSNKAPKTKQFHHSLLEDSMQSWLNTSFIWACTLQNQSSILYLKLW